MKKKHVSIELPTDKNIINIRESTMSVPDSAGGKVSTRSKNINFNQEDSKGTTYLMKYLVTRSDQNMARKILQRGAKIDYQNKNGLTVLHFALKNHNKAAAEFLLERNANPHLEDAQGHDCCDYNQTYQVGVQKLEHCDKQKRLPFLPISPKTHGSSTSIGNPLKASLSLSREFSLSPSRKSTPKLPYLGQRKDSSTADKDDNFSYALENPPKKKLLKNIPSFLENPVRSPDRRESPKRESQQLKVQQSVSPQMQRSFVFEQKSRQPLKSSLTEQKFSISPIKKSSPQIDSALQNLRDSVSNLSQTPLPQIEPYKPIGKNKPILRKEKSSDGVEVRKSKDTSVKNSIIPTLDHMQSKNHKRKKSLNDFDRTSQEKEEYLKRRYEEMSDQNPLKSILEDTHLESPSKILKIKDIIKTSNNIRKKEIDKYQDDKVPQLPYDNDKIDIYIDTLIKNSKLEESVSKSWFHTLRAEKEKKLRQSTELKKRRLIEAGKMNRGDYDDERKFKMQKILDNQMHHENSAVGDRLIKQKEKLDNSFEQMMEMTKSKLNDLSHDQERYVKLNHYGVDDYSYYYDKQVDLQHMRNQQKDRSQPLLSPIVRASFSRNPRQSAVEMQWRTTINQDKERRLKKNILNEYIKRDQNAQIISKEFLSGSSLVQDSIRELNKSRESLISREHRNKSNEDVLRAYQNRQNEISDGFKKVFDDARSDFGGANKKSSLIMKKNQYYNNAFLNGNQHDRAEGNKYLNVITRDHNRDTNNDLNKSISFRNPLLVKLQNNPGQELKRNIFQDPLNVSPMTNDHYSPFGAQKEATFLPSINSSKARFHNGLFSNIYYKGLSNNDNYQNFLLNPSLKERSTHKDSDDFVIQDLASQSKYPDTNSKETFSQLAGMENENDPSRMQPLRNQNSLSIRVKESDTDAKNVS